MSPTAAGPVAPGAVTADDLAGLLAREGSGCAPRERWSARSGTGELARAGALRLGVRTGGRLVAAGLVVVLGADAELLRIVVAPDHRGRAVATGLLDGLAAAAAARGAGRPCPPGVIRSSRRRGGGSPWCRRGRPPGGRPRRSGRP